MPRYKFKIDDIRYETVDAMDLDDALERAGIRKGDHYELIEENDFDDRCLLAAITDEILFGE
jgi:hypothetical protein